MRPQRSPQEHINEELAMDQQDFDLDMVEMRLDFEDDDPGWDGLNFDGDEKYWYESGETQRLDVLDEFDSIVTQQDLWDMYS